MKHTITTLALTLFLVAHGQSLAATSPYSASGSSKTTPSSTTRSTTAKPTPATKSTPAAKPKKPAPKATAIPPPPPPPPPKEESFFSNMSFGLAFIGQNVDVTNKNGATSTTSSESGSGIGIYADKFIDGNYRLNGTLGYVSYDNFIITSLTAAADYIVPLNPSFALFGGLAAGGAGQKYSNSSFSDMSLAMVYGAQLGGIVFISDNLMLELGYRLRLTNLETEISTAPGTTETIDQLNETYLSLVVSF